MFQAMQDVRMDGKTVLITGANVGLGKESALDLAARGARVILACRDVSKGETAAESVRQETKNSNVIVQQLNLASFKSIRECAERINQTEEKLDVLMNNAGLMNCPKMQTEDGFEIQFGVNHLGHFLFTNLLLDLLKKSALSRIVNLSSVIHERGRMNWDDLNFDKGGYDGWTAYGQSKLANILFTKALSRRLSGTGVTTYAVHPGVVSTDLWRTTNRFLSFIARPFCKTPKQGCQTQVYCTVTPGLKTETGLYYADCKVKEPKSQALSEEDAERLWNLSMKLTGLEPAEQT